MQNWKEYIVSDPKILLGKPIIKGSRLSVEFIVSLFAQGWTEEMVLKNYDLKKEELAAVFSYVQDLIKDGLMFESPLKAA
ncbi:MAG: DUF433 domain-containing protein [Saprospiraceae bacterium]|nr:DUF433 domain-containing protein [Saprospiraceae bacterium]